ncbi:MAG: RHS repeat-associated core domain-containing protein [Muribaculaceae bacterium]|nr:RHS repeat-associated core domain-containing protein [Muribaculaceae bacterium]
MSEITMDSGTQLWQFTGESGRGLVTGTASGPLRTAQGYDLGGRVTSRTVRRGRPSVYSSSYQYDPYTGNMTRRTCGSLVEQFTYDGLNRLTGDGNDEYEFDDLGNVTVRGGVGELAYGSTAPYAVTFLTPETGSLVPLREQHIHYNAQQRPDTIAEGGVTATLSYRADGSRAGMTVTEADTTRSYTYRGGLTDCVTAFDAVERTKRVLWLAGTAYDATAALMLDEGDTRWRLHRVVRDHLGSIVAVADSAGYLEQRLSYDAWGALRDPTTGAVYATGASHEPMLLGRGYTGHEHLPWFGLVNMNARLYDPAVARFLSPDPEVQLPDCTQGYNRYTYCLNNPLRYADPTGEEAWYTDDRNEIQQLLDNYNRSGRSWNTNDFARYASSRKAMGGNWTYNRDASFHFSADNTRLFYSYSYGLNGTLNVVGCTAYFSRGGDDDREYGGETNGNYSWTGVGSTIATSAAAVNASLSWASPTLRNRAKYMPLHRFPKGMNVAVTIPAGLFNINTNSRVLTGIARTAKVAGVVGLAASAFDIAVTARNGHSKVAVAKLAVVGIEAACTAFIPIVGPFVALGIAVADVYWGDKYVYNLIDETYTQNQ